MPEEFRRFPILTSYADRRKYPDWPVSIPWRLVAPHEKQALHNHQQTLERLAERGGLDVLELLAVLTDRDWPAVANIDPDQAVTEIMALGGIRRPGKTT